MKKEMRVKDLNPEVQAILRDLIKKSGMRPIQISEASLKDIHELIDWTKATDAERLAYCEVVYKDNTECLFGEAKRKDTVLWPLRTIDSWVSDEKNNAIYNPDTGKFAEIIEEVEKAEPSETKPNPQSIKDRLKGTCVLNEKEGMGAEIVALYTEAGLDNPHDLKGDCTDEYYGIDNNGKISNDSDSDYFQSVLTIDQLREIVRGEKQPFNLSDTGAFSSEPVEFKEGEMVEAWNVDSHYHKVIWSGGKNKDGAFICYLKGTTGGSVCHLRVYENIRKIDPDKEYRYYAKEIMKRYIERDYKRMESMLIEAMKKVQSKK